MTCPFCQYDWVPRVLSPKECPKCKRYLPEQSNEPLAEEEISQ